jgi:hypothetical protein
MYHSLIFIVALIKTMDSLDHAIILKFTPEYRFGSGERHFPMTYERYLAEAALLTLADKKVVQDKPLTVSDLQEFSQSHDTTSDKYALSLLDKDFLNNMITSGNAEAPVYVNTFVAGGERIINYTTFFGADTGKVVLGIVRIGSHMSDIEHVTVVLDAKSNDLKKVYFSAHTSTEGVWVDAADLELNHGRIVVYVAAGSHGNYAKPGTYIRFGGFGNDVADGWGKVWIPPDVHYITEDMTAFRGNLGLDHITNWGGSWFMNVKRNVGGEAPRRLPNGVFGVIQIAILVFVIMFGYRLHSTGKLKLF